jgi:hypothetical protein
MHLQAEPTFEDAIARPLGTFGYAREILLHPLVLGMLVVLLSVGLAIDALVWSTISAAIGAVGCATVSTLPPMRRALRRRRSLEQRLHRLSQLTDVERRRVRALDGFVEQVGEVAPERRATLARLVDAYVCDALLRQRLDALLATAGDIVGEDAIAERRRAETARLRAQRTGIDRRMWRTAELVRLTHQSCALAALAAEAERVGDAMALDEQRVWESIEAPAVAARELALLDGDA